LLDEATAEPALGASDTAALTEYLLSLHNPAPTRHPLIPKNWDLENMKIETMSHALELFGLCQCEFDWTAIKQVYVQKALEWHPDRHASQYKEDATQMMKLLNRAYAKLKYHRE